jgi:hypothetical protein
MSDKAFAKAMGRIAIEAENQRQLEERRERRQRIFSRIRSVGGFLLGAVVLGAGYYYRAQVQDYINSKLAKAPTISAGTGEAIKGIQADAEKRDQVLDSLTSK